MALRVAPGRTQKTAAGTNFRLGLGAWLDIIAPDAVTASTSL